LIFVQAAFGLYGAKSNVVPLSKKNFADNVIGSEHVWVVEFYAPVCYLLILEFIEYILIFLFFLNFFEFFLFGL